MRIIPAILIGLLFCAIAPRLWAPTELCNYEVDVEHFDGKGVYPVTMLIREFDNGSLTVEYVNPFN